MHMVRAAVAGASGYAGGEILRLLLAHPEVEIGAVTAASSAGQPLGAVHPHLTPLADRVIEDTTASVLAGHDVVFLALPHGHSSGIAAELGDDVTVIDCGADFRLRDELAWTAFYDTPYAGSWAYGLPELCVGAAGKQREALLGQRHIAVPGCYPTAAAWPWPRATPPGCSSGTASCRGRLGHLGRRQVAQAPPARRRGHGRHVPVRGGRRAPAHPGDRAEPRRRARRGRCGVSFTPTLAPMPRGILATCTAPVGTAEVSAAGVRAAWERAYADEPFAHLLPEGQWPSTGSVLGSNTVHVQVALDERVGRVVAVAAIDNLTKGTAGAAVQCLNLSLGLPETTGLPVAGVAP